MRTLYNVHVERGKYENQIGSRGQETPDLRPKDVFVRRLGLAGARGRPNGHSVEHHGYNIHISRLQFARTSAVIKNTLIIIRLLNACGPCVDLCCWAVVTYWGLSSFHDEARVLDWGCELLRDWAFALCTAPAIFTPSVFVPVSKIQTRDLIFPRDVEPSGRVGQRWASGCLGAWPEQSKEQSKAGRVREQCWTMPPCETNFIPSWQFHLPGKHTLASTKRRVTRRNPWSLFA